MLASRLASLFGAVAIVFAACGGKTDVPGDGTPDEAGADAPKDVTADVAADVDTGGRICPPNCTVGHQCCKASCGGLPAAMPSSCCSCLSGEVDSLQCPNGKCGN